MFFENNQNYNSFLPSQNHMSIGVRSSRGQSSILPRPTGMLPLPPRLSHTQSRNLMQSDSTAATVPFPPPLPGLGQLGLPPIPPPPPLPPFFAGQIRNPLYDNAMYAMNNRMGTMNPLHIPYGPNALDPLRALNGRSLMDNPYYSSSSSRKYDDYEDQLERFNRQLESRSRRYRDDDRDRSGRSRIMDSRRRAHSRSRSPSSSHPRHLRSRSRSISSRGSSPSSVRSSHRSPSSSNRNRSKRSTSREAYESSLSRNRDDDRRHHNRLTHRSSRSPSSSHYHNRYAMDVGGGKSSSSYLGSDNNPTVSHRQPSRSGNNDQRSRSRSYSKYDKRFVSKKNFLHNKHFYI